MDRFRKDRDRLVVFGINFSLNFSFLDMFTFDLSKVPTSPGVYLWKNKNKVLYVWKAKNLRNRISQYFKTGIWVWKEDMVWKATDIEWIITTNEEEALLLENQLIKKYKPPYNSLLKWDTGYVYIKISDEKFPKIYLTRYKDWWGIYIWPKPWKKDLKNILNLLRQILKYRTCSKTKFNKKQLCSDYMLWLCKWRCNPLKAGSENTIMKKEYDEIIKLIIDYFNGDSESIKKLIEEKINQAIEQQNFEYAAKLRDIYFELDKFINKQIIELDTPIDWYFVKIRSYNWKYFMSYVKFSNWKVIDVVNLSSDENDFIQNMKNDELISECVKLKDNYFFCK